MSEGLFDAESLRSPLAPVEQLSAGRRRTLRQAELIRSGVHPLLAAIGYQRPVLHPDAPRDAARGDRGRPFTCCACAHLAAKNRGTAATYLKCWADGGARVTSGPGTDVRAWWPACGDYIGRTS